MNAAVDKMAETLRELLRAYDKQQDERSMEAGAMAVMALASCRDALAAYEAEKAQPVADKQAEPVGWDTLIADAVAEGEKAMRKFPQPNYTLLKVAEEAGEVVKAGVHFAEGRDTAEHVRDEMKQTIAMLYRLWKEGDQVNGVPAISGCVPKASVVALAAGEAEELRRDAERLTFALHALDEIAAGMSGSGQESEDGMRDWHARRAWEFIGIAARARSEIAALAASKQGGVV